MKKIKNIDSKVIGKNIAERREAKGWSQDTLGKEAGGIAASSICKYEKGDQLPRLDTLYYIACALDCALDELITGEKGKIAIGQTEDAVDPEEELFRHLAALLDGKILFDMADTNGNSYGYGLSDNTGVINQFVDKYRAVLDLRNETGDQFDTVKENTIRLYAAKLKAAKEGPKMKKVGVIY